MLCFVDGGSFGGFIVWSDWSLLGLTWGIEIVLGRLLFIGVLNFSILVTK